ncbi:serine hydrolase [Auraticoccus monumenti]|uniref:CubicO group peptidase, beta-lactamase class C family n=1 Tax=Auraticoccus monumenti TaxID=675864 RepID=A0A1G6T178_9ACTN|nr:serine hydrolase [Auraticoccus monumenti]SDD22930.1 CubicO group peptidase, beta-lactamase class C family [Auraticoccus monumenti]
MNRATRLLACTAALAVCTTLSLAPDARADDGGLAFDDPQPGFAPAETVLGEAEPEDVGLDGARLDLAWEEVRSFTEPQGEARPRFPGGVLTYAHDGQVVLQEATGFSRRYADGQGTDLPREEWIETRTDTIYDLASVSKLFTSIVVMQQVEAGRLALDAPVASYVPEFAENGKGAITVRQLLTHTSGFPAFLPLWRTFPDPASRMQGALTAKLVNEPGSTYLYSDLNLIALGEAAARVSGQPLDALVAGGITEPLGMTDTGYNPDPSLRPRVAATEEQTTPPRGVVWGEVHDENAWSFGGVAGHAGVFSTADDVAVLAQTMLNGGVYDGARILSETSVQQMITNETAQFPDDAHGLGFELEQRWYMGGLASPRTAGHTGYTGTSLVIDFSSRSFAILLTNRVHPSRSWGSVNPARVAAAQGLAEALPVRPRSGADAWFSGTGAGLDSSLDWSTPVPVGGARLHFETFVDTESTDLLHLEVSTDRGTTWEALPWSVDGVPVTGGYAVSGLRQWQHATADVPAGRVVLRWRYTSDSSLSGRGIYLDDIHLATARGTVASAERSPARLDTRGGSWTLASR